MSIKKTFIAGEVLTASDTNTYLQNQGIEPIAQQTVSAVTAINFLNCFSATYRTYQVVFENCTQSVNNVGIYLRYGNSSGGSIVISNTLYYTRNLIAGDTVTNNSTSNAAEALIHMANAGSANGGNTMIYNPFIADRTTSQSQFMNIGLVQAYNSQTLHHVATSYNSLQILVFSGTFSGTIKIYGMV